MEDIPEFIQRGCRVTKRHRAATFPVWERCEMASIWALPLAALTLPVFGLAFDWATGAAFAAVLVLVIAGIFLALPRLAVVGQKRWLTFGGGAALGTATGCALLASIGTLGLPQGLALAGLCAGAMVLLSIDLTGTTPWYPGGVNSFQNHYTVELVTDRCTGVADCVQVCPKDVLAMQGARRFVAIARPDQCMGCGACIVQCPEDALRFRFDDGRVVGPATVRSTRLNMLGRRTVEVEPTASGASPGT
jgi:NAD-dependent dihydropyrimidine dehydrogenase PreA subunit